MDFLLFSFIIFIFCDSTNSLNQCRTPNSLNGICIPIQECPTLLDKIQAEPLSGSDRVFLKESQCGVNGKNPLVCCPVSFTESDLPVPGRCGSNNWRSLFLPEIGDIAWLALIQYTNYDTATKAFLCGGALINENYILTAAHCLRGRNLVEHGWSAISVRLGEHDIETERDCWDTGYCADAIIDIPIAEIIIHESYDLDSISKPNDIALIRLARSVPYTDFIKPICLPLATHLKDKDFDGYPFHVAGFGIIENGNFSNVKQESQVDGISLHQCNKLSKPFGVCVTETQLCTKSVEVLKSVCKIDSGGPLMGIDHRNRLLPYTYLAGILSRAPRTCKTNDYPALFTRVDKYVGWILNHMKH